MTRYWKKKYLLIKAEVSEGLDSGPTLADDAVLAVEVQLNALQGQEASRNIDRPFLGAQPTLMYGKYTSLSFRVEMAGSGTKLLSAGWGKLHRFCGMAETEMSGVNATIDAAAIAVNTPTGVFTYARTTKYNGNTPRLVTLECTTAGGSGVAAFHVTAPKAGDQNAYDQAGVLMTNATPFALGGGAEITPNITADFVVGDRFTIEVLPERVEYSLVSDDFESATIYINIDGALHKMTGCRGNAGWTIQNGIPYWTYTFNGTFNPVESSAIAAANVSAFKDPQVAEKKNTPTFRLHGRDLAMASFNGDFGNVINPRILVRQENIPLADRDITGSCVFDAESQADKDWFATAEQKTIGRLDFQQGVVTGKIVGISSPSVEIRQPQYRPDGNVLQMELGLGFIPTAAGNDELRVWTT